jgi:drug/metabolite transporter (DMT)-like permease
VDIDISLDYGLTLLAALLIGTGFVLQQNAAQGEPDSNFLSLRLITDLLRQPRWLAGIGCMVAGQVLAAWSIGNLSLAFVEPLLTTNLVFALVLSVPIAKATLRFREIFGAVVLCTGVALLSAARSAQPIGLSFGSVSHWPAAAVIAAIAFACAHAGRRHPGRLRAMLTGTGAGLVFGIQDALTRQTLEILNASGAGAMFTTWAPYALVGAGATGIWLMQSAFSAGPLTLSLPAISAGEPLVGILLGVLVFGDRIQISPAELALQAGGIFALIVGVILVGRAPALSQLRRLSPPSLPHITGSLPSLPHLPNLGKHPADDKHPAGDEPLDRGTAEHLTADDPLLAGRAGGPGAGGGRAAAGADEPVERAADAGLVVEQLPDRDDHRGQRPEVPAYPQDGRADLLVGERRQGHPGHVVVRRVDRVGREDRQRHRDEDHHHVGGEQRRGPAEQRHPRPERRRGDELEPEQHPGREERPVLKPDMDGGVVRRQVEGGRDVPHHHRQVEQHHRDDRPGQEGEDGPHRP